MESVYESISQSSPSLISKRQRHKLTSNQATASMKKKKSDTKVAAINHHGYESSESEGTKALNE